MLALNGLVAAAVAVTQYDRSITFDVANGTTGSGRRYLGSGRYVKFNSFSSGFSGGAQCVDVELEYALPYTGSTLLCSDEQCTNEVVQPDAGSIYSMQCRKKDTQRAGTIPGNDCVKVLSGASAQWRKNLLDIGTVTPAQPFFYKAHGTHEVEWFVNYNINNAGTCAAGTEAQLNLNFNARVKNPEELHCGQHDREFPLHYDQPAVSNPTKTVTIQPGSRPGAEDNYYAFNLGNSNMLELGCLHVFSTPADMSCANTGLQIGTDLLLEGPNSQGMAPKVELVETYPCTVHTTTNDSAVLLQPSVYGGLVEFQDGFRECCSQTTFEHCRAHSLRMGVQFPSTPRPWCMWNHETATCYPMASALRKDLKNFVGLNNSVVATFASGKANPPRSSLIATRYLAQQGYELQNNRQWHLVVSNPTTVELASSQSCSLATTVSYSKTNTGGICEPSTRLMCDRQEENCMALGSVERQQSPFELLYWRSRSEPMIPESSAHVQEDLRRDEWTTCNCLKQKEVCYRKNGCLSTKRYQLILQNCMEAGCGNVCNSGAAVHVSAAVLLFAVLALLL